MMLEVVVGYLNIVNWKTAAFLPLPLTLPFVHPLKSQMGGRLYAAEDQVLPELFFLLLWKSNNSFLILHSKDP